MSMVLMQPQPPVTGATALTREKVRKGGESSFSALRDYTLLRDYKPSTQTVLSAQSCADSHSFSQQILSTSSGLHFLLRTGGHQEDGPPSLSTCLKVSRHWIPESLDWETPLLSWFPGMTQTECSNRQSLGFMETLCFLLSNSVILRNHPAVCISCFWSLQMPEAGTS